MPPPTCHFWRRGLCRRGAECRFYHGTDPSLSANPEMLQQTGTLLETIEPLSLQSAAADEVVSLTDYEFLSSYNWVDEDRRPVIYVPGAPPVWQSKPPPFTVAKDQGTYFVDQNTARCARYPTEACFRSLAVMQPQLSMLDVDLVTDRNSLRKLLRFVSADMDRSFRIDVQRQGGVMFLCRWEVELRQVILRHDHFGFGHTFEKVLTRFEPRLQDSSSHHRVVRYRLGGLRCLVRYEADACTVGVEEHQLHDPLDHHEAKKVPDEKDTDKKIPVGKNAVKKGADEKNVDKKIADTQSEKSKKAAKNDKGKTTDKSDQKIDDQKGKAGTEVKEDKLKDRPDDPDDLLDTFKSLSLASAPVTSLGSVQVVHRGRVVPPSTLVEIKTRSVKRQIRLDEIVPQLWFAQTPHLFVGYHINGTFQEVKQIPMKAEFERWEQRHQGELKKLVALISKLNAVASATAEQRCVVVCEGDKSSARMRIYTSQRNGDLLPADLLDLHAWPAEGSRAAST